MGGSADLKQLAWEVYGFDGGKLVNGRKRQTKDLLYKWSLKVPIPNFFNLFATVHSRLSRCDRAFLISALWYIHPRN